MTDSTEFNIPVGAVYILDPSGIPLFARYYQGELANTDSALLGGFFSAIEIFVKTSMDGLLSDIGMTTSRFFFDRSESGHIIVIIVFTNDTDFIEQSSLRIVRALQSTIGNSISIVTEVAKSNLMKVEGLIESLGTAMDSFLLETSFEYLETDAADQDYYATLRSEPLDEEKMERIIETIKKNRS